MNTQPLWHTTYTCIYAVSAITLIHTSLTPPPTYTHTHITSHTLHQNTHTHLTRRTSHRAYISHTHLFDTTNTLYAHTSARCINIPSLSLTHHNHTHPRSNRARFYFLFLFMVSRISEGRVIFGHGFGSEEL